ncbi:LacI family DNA-binding transcriptional regulator [Pseudomonas entomophila]|uniref:LacI family DNA-binding transcriptional regulator n=1 Tax=Pseudomonas sp. RIT-PI-S TaxID=3035295 RepID=UPI0021D96C0D
MSRQRRGAGRVTLATVAALAEVSAMTVSRYFNEPARVSEVHRERIAAAIAATGYVPNQVAGGLASSKNRIVGLVVPNISGPIFASTIQAFHDTLGAQGYQVLMASSYFSAQQEENAVRAFLGWAPAALVVTSHFHTPATERMLASASVPVLEVWDYQPQRQPIQVGFDHTEVGRMAVEHLHGRGYRRIAFVANSATGDHSALERRDGYVQALARHGLAPILYQPDAALPPFEAGKQALEALMAQATRPDAIFFANDNLAAGGLLAAQRAGVRIPGDCAVLGFGDYPFAQMLMPSLSTLRPPAREIGEQAAAYLLASFNAVPDRPAPPAALHCTLVQREST